MAATPPLVWADGRPIDFRTLRREVSAPALMSSRSINSGHPSQGLTPARLGALLIEAEQGNAISYLELAEEIEEKEWHYAGVLGTRKRAVAQLPIEVEAADDSTQAKDDAAFITQWLQRDTLEMELVDILDAIGKGHSVTEIIWDCQATQWLPQRLETRDPRWFRFDPIDGRTLSLWTQEGAQPLAPFKFIAHVHPNKTGIPIRGGLARPAAWAWMFKNFALKEWLTFIEVYGMPLRIGKFDNGESEENIRLLMGAIQQIGTDASAVFPKSMDVEFIDGKSKGAGGQADTLFRSMCDYIDQQLSKLVLGQTATTDAIAGGHAVGKVHNDVRADIERADAKLLAATLNRDLVRPMVILNRGERSAYPRLKIGRPEPVDIAAMTAALNVLVPLGLKVSEQEVRQRAGFADPKPSDAVLTAPSPQALKGEHADMTRVELPAAASRGATGLLTGSYGGDDPSGEVASADDISIAADEALGDWLPAMTAMVEPLDAAAADASDLLAYRDKLVGTLSAMNVDELTEMLAAQTFKARIMGTATTEAPPGALP